MRRLVKILMVLCIGYLVWPDVVETATRSVVARATDAAQWLQAVGQELVSPLASVLEFGRQPHLERQLRAVSKEIARIEKERMATVQACESHQLEAQQLEREMRSLMGHTIAMTGGPMGQQEMVFEKERAEFLAAAHGLEAIALAEDLEERFLLEDELRDQLRRELARDARRALSEEAFSVLNYDRELRGFTSRGDGFSSVPNIARQAH